MHQLLSKAVKAIESSEEKEKIYQLMGDVLVDLPSRIQHLERCLDEVSYTLCLLGEDFLKDRLNMSSKARIDTAVEGAPSLIRSSRVRIVQKASP